MDVFADNQFECLIGALVNLWACLNIAAADEHVPEVERCIRTDNQGESVLHIQFSHIQENAYQVDCRNDLHNSVLAK